MSGPIVLVGLMGSGKSTVGRRLAVVLDRPFVDADDELEARTGRSIADIFDTDGEDAFRDLEAELLVDLLARADAPVIATGGGVVLRPANRAALRETPGVTVVWLNGSPDFLASRTKPKPHRPLLGGGADARVVLRRLFDERAPLYREVVDLDVSIEPFHVDVDKPKQAMADHIAELLTGVAP